MAGHDALVGALTARLRPLDIDANRAWWLSSTDVSDAHEQRRVHADLVLGDALSDTAAFREIRGALTDSANEREERQLRLLHDRFLPRQIASDLRTEIVRLEAKIDSTFNAFRGRIDGADVDDNAIAGILRTSRSADERRSAWEAAKQVGAEVADQVRELARLRNRAARSLGFRDYFAMVLATTELSEDRLFATLDLVDQATRAPFAHWKEDLDRSLAGRFGCAPDELRPWHYDDVFFQSVPRDEALELDDWLAGSDLEALTARTYDGIGLDIRPALERSDLEPRAGKSQHAFCIDLDRDGDVRVLCNIVPNERWAETMLHEFGHAAYDLGTDPELPWLLRDMHALVTEGVAMLFGRLVHTPRWLTEVAAVDRANVEAVAARLADTRRAALLVFARWVLVMTNFERALYADPDADHNAAWWDLVGRYQLVQRPDGRHEPDWAAKIHLAVAPVYYQNYLYGELVASQLQATLERECGGIVDEPSAGALLAGRVFAIGHSARWDRIIEQATGEPLSVGALAAEVGAG